jgi:glutamyl/glutaminyl-tRNA synthetase
MGKNKPNKNKRDYHVDYFQEFNQMIEKLYEINREYEEVKHQKKTNSNGQSSLRSIEEEEERKEEELESSERSRSEKSFSNKSASLRVSIEKIEGQDDIKGDFN